MTQPKEAATKTVHLFTMLAETLLGLRVILSLFNADVANDMVRWVYETTQPLLEPLRSVIGNQSYSTTYVLEFQVLLAMAVYGLVGYLAMSYIEKAPKPKTVSYELPKFLRR